MLAGDSDNERKLSKCHFLLLIDDGEKQNNKLHLEKVLKQQH
jgi:hypothetical protein